MRPLAPTPSTATGCTLSAAGEVLWQGRRLRIGPWAFAGAPARDAPAPDGAACGSGARALVEAAHAAAGPAGLRHLVVGVVGPRAATAEQTRLARDLGRALGALTLTTVCGGRSGVMEAVCRPVEEVGGLSIGVLPGTEPGGANPHVGIPLPTGLSEGRNMVIARAARVLIAVGGSYGTITEMAYGLHFGKVVVALDTAPDLEGLVRATDVAEAVEIACAALLEQAKAAAAPPDPS